MKVFRREKKVSKRYSKTREQLREIARKHGVKRGRNTEDTVRNLKAAKVSWSNQTGQERVASADPDCSK
jgi:hypothetical protein